VSELEEGVEDGLRDLRIQSNSNLFGVSEYTAILIAIDITN
jgi:hypothetical protein